MAGASGTEGEIVVVAVVSEPLVEAAQLEKRRPGPSEVSPHQDGERAGLLVRRCAPPRGRSVELPADRLEAV